MITFRSEKTKSRIKTTTTGQLQRTLAIRVPTAPQRGNRHPCFNSHINITTFPYFAVALMHVIYRITWRHQWLFTERRAFQNVRSSWTKIKASIGLKHSCMIAAYIVELEWLNFSWSWTHFLYRSWRYEFLRGVVSIMVSDFKRAARLFYVSVVPSGALQAISNFKIYF